MVTTPAPPPPTRRIRPNRRWFWMVWREIALAHYLPARRRRRRR